MIFEKNKFLDGSQGDRKASSTRYGVQSQNIPSQTAEVIYSTTPRQDKAHKLISS